MANQEHLDILKQGVVVWNKWRQEHPHIQPDLSEVILNAEQLPQEDVMESLRNPHFTGADYTGVDLSKSNLDKAQFLGANLSHANLSYATLSWALLSFANFSGADLSGSHLNWSHLNRANFDGAVLDAAVFDGADLRGTKLCRASLKGASFMWAALNFADLSSADLSGASLRSAILVHTNLEKANLSNCSVHGISIWNIQLKNTIQLNLIISDYDEPEITVDNIEVAQFIYLLLNNQNIRDVIDTITSKVVLILGRFTDERKKVLDDIRDALRKHNYTPILFDFEKPASRDITETVSTLAHMARFVIADITDAKSIPQELMTIVPNLPSVPVLPLILNTQHEYGMFEHFTRFPWVLPVYRYADEGSLLKSLQEKVIIPAEQKAKELEEQ